MQVDRSVSLPIMRGPIIAVLAALLSLTSLGGSPVAAQDANTYPFVISATACDDFPVTAPETQCQPKVGAVFRLTTESGEALGSCTTEPRSQGGIAAECAIDLPFGITVVVFEDPATIPAGYVPVENPQVVETPPNLAGAGEPPAVAFVNVLQEMPPTNGEAARYARITLHVATCPQETEGLFEECHENRQDGVEFRVAGVRKSTDENGVVSWGPGAGEHAIVEDPETFAAFGWAYVYCEDQVNGDVLFDGPVDDGRATITTTGGQPVVCDWYNLTPATGRYAPITLHVAECPRDPADLFDECHENRVSGFTFYIAGSAKVTDANGVATGAPGAGRRSIRADVDDFQAYGRSYVYCTDQVTGDVLFDGQTYSGVYVTTTADQPVICDWYLLTGQAGA